MEKLVIIAGTNASGKSDLGVNVALAVNGEVISADSRQVYKGLDLGSGKITKEEMRGVPHHLIDVAAPNDYFSLADYQKLAYEAIDSVIKRGKTPLLVGGTGLYINAVADGYELEESAPDAELRARVETMGREELIGYIESRKPEALEGMDLFNKRRLERAVEKLMSGATLARRANPRFETLVIGVTWPREVLYKRIEERLDRRLNEGMTDEVAGLLKAGVTEDFLYRLGLEYRHILLYLTGRYASFEAFREELFKEIRHLAKEQMTWFRKRKDIHWIDMSDDPVNKAVDMIDAFTERS